MGFGEDITCTLVLHQLGFGPCQFCPAGHEVIGPVRGPVGAFGCQDRLQAIRLFLDLNEAIAADTASGPCRSIADRFEWKGGQDNIS